MQEILDATGMSRATFYRYLENKKSSNKLL
ncbi:hypothetical protein [Guptibacillus hwajinpoensis]